MIQEIWKPILSVEGTSSYEVSNLGNVRTALFTDNALQKKRSGKLLKPNLVNSGYPVVWLRHKGKSSIRLVHRLVAEAFCGESKKQVNHKDGNKLNNVATNLEWVSAKENNQHAIDTGLRLLKLSFQDRESIRDLYFNQRLSQKQIAKKFNVTDVLISQLLTGGIYKSDNGQIRIKNRYLNTNTKTARKL